MTTTGGAVLDLPPAGAALHPRHDPAFADRLVNDLMEHFGEWRDLGQMYASHIPSFERCQVVRDVIRGAERVGLQIDAERGSGYRLTGFIGYRWVHINKALAWPAEPDHDDRELPGQLTLGVDGE